MKRNKQAIGTAFVLALTLGAAALTAVWIDITKPKGPAAKGSNPALVDEEISALAQAPQAPPSIKRTRATTDIATLEVREVVMKKDASLPAQMTEAIKTDPRIAGLTKEIQIEKGKKVFLQTCFVCHQADGQGIPGQIPPLARSDYLMADKKRSVRIVLQGQTGKLKVNNKTYNGTMIPLDYLSDENVANVLTYVRNSFGNSGDPVSVEEVQRIRSEAPPPAANPFE